MRLVFADTFYWIAMASPRDHWNTKTVAVSNSLGPALFVTTDAVLIEFLNAYAAQAPERREAAARNVRGMLKNPTIKVIEQDRALFLEGLELYESRKDKGYSLTDCISMVTMRKEKLTDVLTNDHHFTQESFTILIV